MIKHVDLNIWLACNLKCTLCLSWQTKRRKKIYIYEKCEKIEQDIKNLKNQWFNSIWLLWWEWTTHPNFIKILNKCKQIWFQQIHIISNWIKFRNKKYIEQIIENWITRISVSVHSHIDEIEEKLCWGIKWVLEKKILWLKNLVQLFKIWILKNAPTINFVVNKKNYKQILNSISFFYKLWIKDFAIIFITIEWLNQKNIVSLWLKYLDFKDYIPKIIKLKKLLKLNLKLLWVPFCVSWISIDDYAQIWEIIDKNKTKISSDDKDYSRDSLNQRKYFSNYMIKFKKCSDCELYQDCNWVWKRYIDFFWDSEFL